jgi:hypothetical protein
MALLDDSIRRPTSLRGDFEDGTRWTVVVNEYSMPDDSSDAPPISGMLPGGQQQVVLPVKLFSYTVEIIGPESHTPDYRLETLKLVNVTEPAGPVRNTQ